MPRTKRPYGKVCARDVSSIRNVIRTNMKKWSLEFQTKPEVVGLKPRERVTAWYNFLKSKVGEEIKKLPIECV
ncbi:MAG: hypothetical protein QW290_09350 [Sulfolobales archaeon]